MEGQVNAISQKNNAVQINETWYTLGEKVKMSYVRKGPCEYSFLETSEGKNPILTYIKCTAQASPGSFTSGAEYKPEVDLERDKRIVRQNCNQRAIEAFKLLFEINPEKAKEILGANDYKLVEVLKGYSIYFEDLVWRKPDEKILVQ